MKPIAYNWVNPSWSIFRYLGDVSHLLSILILLYKMLSKRTAHGVSGKTQICYLVVFCTRYLNKSFLVPPIYNIIFRILFIASSLLVVVIMHTSLSLTYEKRHDTFRIIFIFIAAAILSWFTMAEKSYVAYASAFSLWVECVAIIPQMILLRRSKRTDVLNREYVFFLSLYRVFYLLNWLTMMVQRNWRGQSPVPRVHWISGIVQSVVYSDFIFRYIKMRFKGESDLLPI
jgi:ER lumen protein retaining receptor